MTVSADLEVDVYVPMYTPNASFQYIIIYKFLNSLKFINLFDKVGVHTTDKYSRCGHTHEACSLLKLFLLTDIYKEIYARTPKASNFSDKSGLHVYE